MSAPTAIPALDEASKVRTILQKINRGPSLTDSSFCRRNSNLSSNKSMSLSLADSEEIHDQYSLNLQAS